MVLSPSLSRRFFITGAAATSLAACGQAQARAPQIVVYKDPNCGCCGAWVEHLRNAGFAISVVETSDLATIRTRHGLPDSLASCHTGVVAGYAIEGHVPGDDIKRLLAQRPDARGLAVPGMPLGSPGMDAPDGSREPYEVLLVRQDGTTEVFARHS